MLEAIGSLGIVEKVLEQRQKHVLLTDFIRLESLPGCFFDGLISEGPAIIRSSLRKVSFSWEDFEGKLLYSWPSDESARIDTDFNSEFQSEWVVQSDAGHTDADILAGLTGRIRRYLFKGLQHKVESRLTKAGLQFPFGENIASSIQLLPRLRSEVAELISEFGFKLMFDNNELRIFKELDNGNIFSLGLQSTADTLQRLIFHKAAIASNQNAVLLFEDPEAHMFPPYIRKLTWDIVKSETNQFFLTTHSPFVLDSLMEEAPDELSVYLLDYRDGETKIQLLSQEHLAEIREYGVDLFFNIESYLKRGQSDPA